MSYRPNIRPVNVIDLEAYRRLGRDFTPCQPRPSQINWPAISVIVVYVALIALVYGVFA